VSAIGGFIVDIELISLHAINPCESDADYLSAAPVPRLSRGLLKWRW
jgi:hypothetical protein